MELPKIILNKISKKIRNNLLGEIRLSEKNLHNFIETCYGLLLNRNPDKEGLDFYSNLIKTSGDDSLKIFIEKIIESEEFDERFISLWKKEALIKKSYWEWIKSNDENYLDTSKLNLAQVNSEFKRTDVINLILESRKEKTSYLEIGVRNLEDNFNLINANIKYSVDPGYEVLNNNADFKLKSDDFFNLLTRGEILSPEHKFDVIFIDGLHLAEQVDNDITNSLKFIKNDGFVVLHDCNPPTEWHAREIYEYHKSPAGGAWNGTVWKAFLKRRFDESLKCCCIDSDWGIGVISKKIEIGSPIKNKNPFFEYEKFSQNRENYLNLITFEKFKNLLSIS